MTMRKACVNSVWKFKNTSSYFLPMYISDFFIKGICINNTYMYPVVKSSYDIKNNTLEYVRPSKHLFLDFFNNINIVQQNLDNPLYEIFYKDNIKYLVIAFNKKEYIVLFQKDILINWKILNCDIIFQEYQFLGRSALTFNDFL